MRRADRLFRIVQRLWRRGGGVVAAAALVSTFAAACSTSRNLVSLADASLHLNLSPSALSLFVVPATPTKDALATSADGQKHACKKVSTDAKAAFNDIPLERMTGLYARGDLAYDRDCLLEFAFPGGEVVDEGGGKVRLGGPMPRAARSAAAAVLHLEDRSARWTFSIPDAFTARTLSLVSPPAGRPLRRGDTVVLRWSPPSDGLSDKGIGVGLRNPDRPLEGVTISGDHLTVDGDRLTFTVPTDAPASLDGPIVIQFLGSALVQPRRGPCPIKSCSVSLQFAAVSPIPATLAP